MTAISFADCAASAQRVRRVLRSAARHRTDSPATRRFGTTAFVLLVLVGAAGCRRESEARVAERILERYRSATGARPLARSHVIEINLTSDAAAAPAGGVAEVAWRDGRYRERTASAGAVTERGIQGGKAYYVDEDGFTRVVSEPVLAELLSRSYFWRKAWLFADRERARAHTTIAVPGATAQSMGLPDNNKQGGAWIMNAGTSTAHLMIPGH